MKIKNWTFDNVQKSVSTTLCSYPIKKALRQIQGDPTKAHKTQGTDGFFGEKHLPNMPRRMAVVALKSSPRGRRAALGKQLPAHQSNHPWSWLSHCSAIQYLRASGLPGRTHRAKGRLKLWIKCHGWTSLSSVLHGQVKAAIEVLACQPVTGNNKKRKARQLTNGVVQLFWTTLLLQ